MATGSVLLSQSYFNAPYYGASFRPHKQVIPNTSFWQQTGMPGGASSSPGETMVTSTRPGSYLPSFFNDFYNRIYFRPAFLGVGAIGEDSQYDILVWNAYYSQTATLTSVSFPDNQGLELAGPDTPVELPPLGTATYSLTVLGDGPPILDATIQWEFDLTGIYDFRVSGNRAKLWTFMPSWDAASYQVTYAYSTEILTSRSGDEQRRSLRRSPRKTVEYTARVHHREFQSLKRLVWYWQAREFILPELPTFVLSTSVLAAGDQTVTLASLPPWMAVNRQVILRNDADMELKTISAIDPTKNQVTFSGLSSADWSAGTRIHPALPGHIPSPFTVSRKTNAVAEVQVTFDVDPLSDLYVEPGAPGRTWQGRELLMLKPNWAEPVSVQSAHPTDDVDYDRGPITRFEVVDFGYDIRSATYLARTYDDAMAMLATFRRAKGRRGEFVMPTWEDDIPIEGMQVAGISSSLRVPGTSFYDQFANNDRFTGLCVLLNDGTTRLRKILSMSKSVGSSAPATVVNVDGVWDVDISPDTVTLICWLQVCRFASDSLTIEWVTNSVAQFRVAVQTLRDLPVETIPDPA